MNKHLRILVVLVCLTVFISFAALVLTQPISQDEGVFLTIGKYLNQGWLPYRDLVDHKPPAIYFLFALLFKIFGTNVFVVKIGLILTTLGTSALVVKIGEILKKGTGWYAAGIFLFLMTQFEGNFLMAEPFLLLPLLFSLWLLLRLERGSPWLFLAGVSLAVAILFKQTAVLSAIPLLVLAYKSTHTERFRFLAGFLLPFLVLSIYLFSNGILAEAWHQIVRLTLMSYPREPLRYVLHSLQHNFLWTLPIWMLVLVGLKTSFPHKQMLWAFVLLPLPFMFFRHYPHYWVQILPFVALIAAVTLIDIRRKALMLATLIFCTAIAGGKVGQDAIPNFKLLKEQLQVADVLKHEPVDALLAENQFTGFYFLLPQKPLNKFLYITEITNAEQAEQRTIEDLQRGQPVMILWPENPDYAYAKKLQVFILEHSSEQKVFTTPGMRVITYQK